MQFKYFKFSLIRSKVLSLGVFEPTKQFAAESAAYVFCNRQGKQAFLKENEKKYPCKINL